MPLEATMICLDNSEYMRNGDFTPSRFEAQQDAVQLIAEAKTQQNPENTVGVMTGAGNSPQVLITLTTDIGKILTSIHGIKLSRELDFISTIQVAQLALKHRQNKNQQQRIIIFVGSPVKSEVEELVRLAKRLKKNNVAVDVVNFGEADNTEKLEAFVDAVKNKENSHIITIPPGPHVLSDILLSSPILTEGETGGSGPSATGGPAVARSMHADYGGIDPNLDPELAMVMKMSLEEERARQATKTGDSEQKMVDEPSVSANQPASQQQTPQPVTTTAQTSDDMDLEDEELRKALEMSLQNETASVPKVSNPAPQPTPLSEPPAPAPVIVVQPQQPPVTNTTQTSDDMDLEDEELRKALEMSLQNEKASQAPQPSQPAPQQSQPVTHQTPTPQKSAPVAQPSDDMDSEEAELQKALAMSLQNQAPQTSAPQQSQPAQPQQTQPQQTKKEEEINKVMEDPAFLTQILSGLPGVDPNSEQIKNILDNLNPNKKKEEKK